MNLLEPQKVLVADDDAINRRVLAELLKPDYTVLLDVVMPDMDGYEVLCRLRADPQTAHTTVIVVCGLNRPEDETNGLGNRVAWRGLD
jgi:CheY-like chemotaxis protein